VSQSDAVVLITGAGHGIGRATARLFATEGARLALGDINEETLADVAKECESLGGEVWTQAFDQRERASVDALFRGAADHFGRLDVSAHIAGIYPTGTVVGTPDETWDDVIATNLTGVFYCCRAAARIMVEQRAGCIVNVASGAAEIPYTGLAAYSASKGGVEAFTRALAKEMAPDVRVNAIAPGPTVTWPQMDEDDSRTEDGFAAAALITDGIPLGRWMKPEEIADGIAFLASDRASAIYGQILRVNGGNHMA
jgi:3-oxoacyl-[acyl-carrier protein] reductase